MAQDQNVSKTSSGSLKLLCPCGFSKRLPSSFDGKKVVCPKCKKVLSVTKVKRARLLTQCPYCQKAQRFEDNLDLCRSCNKSFKTPKLIEELRRKSETQDSTASPVGEEGSRSDSPIDVGPQPQVAVVPARKKPRKRSVVWQVLAAIFYIGGSTIVAWIVAGEKLGLPSIGEVTGLSPKVSHPVASVGTPEAAAVSDDAQANPDAVQSEADSPKLLSPSVSILGGEFVVDQLLDQQTSKPVGSKTMIDLQVKNLTRCEIVNIVFKLDCTQEDGEITTVSVDRVNFAQGLMSEATGVLSLVCEPGAWESIAVSIVSVESEDQADRTTIGPYLIARGDRLIEK